MNNQKQKTYKFHIHGMHCNACVLLTESELCNLPYITNAKSSLKTHSVEIDGDFGDKPAEVVAEELTKVLIGHGYSLSLEGSEQSQGMEKPFDKLRASKSDFKIAIPIALGFTFLFVLLQKLGLVNIVDMKSASYGTALMIGIVASLSSCVAVVGGLLLSMSATFAKGGQKVRPQLLFHLGRIASFFVFGGIIGMIGSAFTLNTPSTFILDMAIGIVMLILGINLLDIFDWTKKLHPSMPKFVSKHALSASKLNHVLTPLVVGIATFFLPCGFTQSMQIYTLSTGNFLSGGLTMLAFALGTFPVLALISFGSFGFKNSSKSGIFFKSAGLIVIVFAVFNLINSLVIIGVIPPVFNF